MATVDLELLKTIMTLMKPEPVLPVAPIAPLAPVEHRSGESAIGMAKDIEYLRGTVDNIEKKLDKMTETHVTVVDFSTHVKENEKAHDDFERRMREQGTRQTQILTVVSILTFVMAGITVWSKLSGH